jgi:hypothetical protein
VILRRRCAVRGSPCGVLVPSGGLHVVFWGLPWVSLECPGACLVLPVGPLCRPGATLASPWGALGASWGLLGAPPPQVVSLGLPLGTWGCLCPLLWAPGAFLGSPLGCPRAFLPPRIPCGALCGDPVGALACSGASHGGTCRALPAAPASLPHTAALSPGATPCIPGTAQRVLPSMGFFRTGMCRLGFFVVVFFAEPGGSTLTITTVGPSVCPPGTKTRITH